MDPDPDRAGAGPGLLGRALVRRSGATLSPAWYATALTAVATACVLLAPETAGRPLDAASDRASDARG